MPPSGPLSHFEGLGGDFKQVTFNDALFGCNTNLSRPVRFLSLFAPDYPRLDQSAVPGRNTHVLLKEVLIRFAFRYASV